MLFKRDTLYLCSHGVNNMSLISKVLNKLTVETVSAHCDVPCGIYDPYPAQVAAHTVVRMAGLIQALDKNDPEYDLKYGRYTAVKEEHGELAKHEIRVIWGDFMKPDNTADYPNVSNLVWDIMKKGGAARQSAAVETAQALLEAVLEFSEIFWKIKGKNPRRVAAPFPSGGQIVLPE